MSRPVTVGLTERELQVANLFIMDVHASEIALRLHISIGTVKNHLARVMEKLNLSSRGEIAWTIAVPNHQAPGDIDQAGLERIRYLADQDRLPIVQLIELKLLSKHLLDAYELLLSDLGTEKAYEMPAPGLQDGLRDDFMPDPISDTDLDE